MPHARTVVMILDHTILLFQMLLFTTTRQGSQLQLIKSLFRTLPSPNYSPQNLVAASEVESERMTIAADSTMIRVVVERIAKIDTTLAGCDEMLAGRGSVAKTSTESLLAIDSMMKSVDVCGI